MASCKLLYMTEENEMAKTRKLLSLFLCLVMVLSFFPAAYAEGENEGTITEEQDCDHDHEHEEETQGTIAPVEEEPEDELVGDGVLDVPETDETDEGHEGLVRVEFICDPEDTIITVYDPSQTDENGEPVVISMEAEGTWLLAPGEYWYDAECEGYKTIRGSFQLTYETAKELILSVLLSPSCVFDGGDMYAGSSPFIDYGVMRMPVIDQIEETSWNVINSSGVSGEQIVAQAKKYLGTPYDTSGGDYKTRTGFGTTMQFDCSGFVYRVCRDLDLTSDRQNYSMGVYDSNGMQFEGKGSNGKWYITAHTYEQKNYGQNLANAVSAYKESGDTSLFAPGDLLFYDYNGDNVTDHVEIYVGNGRNIGATVSKGISEHPFTCGQWYNGKNLDSFLYAACRLVDNSSGLGTHIKDTFQSYLTTTATQKSYVKTLPCSRETDANSDDVAVLSTGDSFEVDKLILNDKGNYWYHGKTTDGQSGYVYSKNFSVKSYNDGTISYTGKTFPSTVEAGKTYDIDWTITSSLLNLDSISGSINFEPGSVYGSNTGRIENINAKSKNLKGTSVDNNLHFESLPSGSSYLLTISATAYNYYCTDGSTLQIHYVNKMPIYFQFAVVEAASPTYYLDLNGFLDGKSVGNLGEYGSADVFINDQLDASWVNDYYKQWPTGTTYEIRCRTNDGYLYNGVHSSGASASGTIGSSNVTVVLSYSTACSVTYKNSSGDITKTIPKGEYVVEANYDKLSNSYFMGWSYSPNATMFDIRPGEMINVTGDVTLYPVYISHADATSGQPALIYNISDFPADGYTITQTNKDVSVTTTESEWSAWSDWSTTAVSSSDTVQVESRTAYGWYYFECPNCHAHMHGYGTCWTWCGGCGASTTAGSWHQMYDPTNWSVAKDWYGTGKYYATINGETWFKWDDGGTQTQYRSRKLVTNTTTTNKTYTAYVIRPAVGYTVSYDANGGTGAPAVQSKYQGQTLTLSTTRPTRSCHVFLGWATSKTATTAQYQPGGQFTTDANTVLYAVWKEGTQSEWSTTKPSGVDDSLIETKTQYRYADKETTTSDQSTLSGWTLYDTKSSWSDWGAWSDWSESSATASDSCQVETRTAYGYYYYVCSNCGVHMHGYGTCYTWAGGCGKSTISSGSYHSVYLATPYSSSADFHGTGVNYVDSSSDGRVFAFTNPSNQYYRSPITQYRYRTRTLNYTYYFYRWKDWSDWGDTVYTASDSRQVETRTLYRYVQSGDVHQWDSGKVTTAATCTTKGVMTYTCTKCGKTRTTEIAAIGHSWGTPSYTWSSDYKTVVASRTCSHNSSHVDSETVNTVPTISTQPTCTALGKTTYTATFSNSAFAKQTKTVENITALGHSWGEWKVTTPATVDKDGVQTRTCSRCGATETRSYAAETVTITFNANGGSVSPASVKILKNGSISSLPTPTYTGRNFNGWFTAASGGTQVTTSTTFAADTTIYAHWTMITYSIVYNANGGTGAPEAQDKTHDVTLKLSTVKPTRASASAGNYMVTLDANGGSVSTNKLTAARTTCYTFKNWNTAANGSGTAYNPGANYTANADVTLYAQWNSGTTTATVTLPTPTREGYSFKGWAASASATSGMTGSYTPSGDVTLYAIWERVTEGSLEIMNVSGRPGQEIQVPVSLSANPGLYTMNFHVVYDNSVLKFVGVEDGSLSNWMVSANSGYVHWETPDDTDKTGSGVIVKLRFQILENAADGELALSIDDLEAFTREEEAIYFGRIPGIVTVSSRIAGDVNGDGEVSILDLVRFRKYLMHDTLDINASNADVTGDGSVNSQDLVRLRKYLVGDPTAVLD